MWNSGLGYAILLLPEHIVELVAALTEIEYMEKPKLLFFAVNNGRRVSCINQLCLLIAFVRAMLPGKRSRRSRFKDTFWTFFLEILNPLNWL